MAAVSWRGCLTRCAILTGLAFAAAPDLVAQQAPKIVSISPASGSTSGGTRVSITLSQTVNSYLPVKVYFQGVLATNVSASGFSVSATSPARPEGLASISVIAANGYNFAIGSAGANEYRYVGAPVTPPTAPSISSHPANQVVSAGAAVTLSVSASGTAPLAYQWRKGGTNIVGANGPSYGLPNVQPSDAGSFDVIVSNAVGNVTSQPATLTVSATSVPVFTLAPRAQSPAEGDTLALTVTVAGTPTPLLEWQRNGIPLVNGGRISGADSAALRITGIIASDTGTYTCVATNSMGNATSPGAAVTVVPAGLAGTQSLGGPGYLPGGTVVVTNTLTYSGTATSLGWQVLIPPGWSYLSGSGSEGDVRPLAGQTELLEWAWSSPPASPVTFSYTLKVPATETANRAVAGLAIVRLSGSSGFYSLLAKPDPLPVPRLRCHAADTDGNFQLSLVELTRMIELYNTRNGTTRTGCYDGQDGSEDGFVTVPARPVSALVTLLRYHSADYDRNGRFSLIELTRVIELYNHRTGTARLGQYHVMDGTEDGYAPGPGPISVGPEVQPINQ